MVTGGLKDETVRLGDLTAKDPAAAPIVLRGDERWIASIAISRDNKWLVTGSGDGTVRLWNLRLNEVVDLASRTVGRNLTQEEWKQYRGEQPYEKTCSNLPIHASVMESARDTAKKGDIKSAVAQFKMILKIEPGLAINPEEEAKKNICKLSV